MKSMKSWDLRWWACSSWSRALVAQAPSEALQPVATINQLMVEIIHPAANDILLLVHRGGPSDAVFSPAR